MTADRVARHLFFALAPQGGTLLEVPKFLSDRAYRTKYYSYMAEHQGTSFDYWHDYYDALGYARDPRSAESKPMRRVPSCADWTDTSQTSASAISWASPG